MTELEFVRIDRNGTKIYHDWTCPRCGGAGQSDNWWRTGKICYECGGTGKRRQPKVVKEYTAEYKEKLEKRRAAKQPKVEFDEAAHLECMRRKLANEGFNADGIAYAYQGNTYKYKDEFRKAGAKWHYTMWISPIKIDCGIVPTELNANGFYNASMFNLHDILEAAGMWA